MDNEKLTLIDDALCSLEPIQRRVFVKVRFERLSYEDVANTEGVPLSIVEAHMRASLHIIRQHLEKKEIESA